MAEYVWVDAVGETRSKSRVSRLPDPIDPPCPRLPCRWQPHVKRTHARAKKSTPPDLFRHCWPPTGASSVLLPSGPGGSQWLQPACATTHGRRLRRAPATAGLGGAFSHVQNRTPAAPTAGPTSPGASGPIDWLDSAFAGLVAGVMTELRNCPGFVCCVVTYGRAIIVRLWLTWRAR